MRGRRASLLTLLARSTTVRTCVLAGVFVSPIFAGVQGRNLRDPGTEPNDLKKRIEEVIRASGAEMVAVAYRDLATGDELLINPDESFHAASTMKVAVMMEVYRQAQEGKLSLSDHIVVKTEFKSIVDGSSYTLSPGDDSDQALYKRVGQPATIRELVRLMITVSSNLATNLLIERITASRVMALMNEIGAKNMRVLRGVEDGKAFRQGLINTTTARDLSIILELIAKRRAISERASDEMIGVLLDQKFNKSIPAGLPKGCRVAHKTGSITRIKHDAAIVYPPRGKAYVLVVLTRGIESDDRSHQLIATISRYIYEARE